MRPIIFHLLPYIRELSRLLPAARQGCEQIKFKYLGVSGVYKLINKNEPNSFYIGSSNNLARRMEEYNKLTKGLRKPYSSSELEISKFSALD
jgi:hypothetical protein